VPFVLEKNVGKALISVEGVNSDDASDWR